MKKLIILFLAIQMAFSQSLVDNFPDFSTFTKLRTTTILSSGLNVNTTGNEFINTGRITDENTYSVEISGICLVNNASHFGFGLKDGTNFRSIIYRGTSGEVTGLKYNSTTLDNPSWRTGATGSGYVVGDKVSLKLYFEGPNISWKVGVNDVWQPMRNANKSFNLGELVIVIRSASQWGSIGAIIESKSNFSDARIAPNGNDLTGDGTIWNPYKTIGKANDVAKGQGFVIPMDGDYFDDLTFDFKRNIKISKNHNARFIYGERIYNASLISGSSRVYSIPHAAFSGSTAHITFWQHDVADDETFIPLDKIHPLHRGKTNRMEHLRCTYKSSVANLESSDPNKSYWYWLNGVLYFTIKEGTNLQDNPLVIPSKGDKTAYNHCVGDGRTGTNVVIDGFTLLYAPIDFKYTTFVAKRIKGGCVSSFFFIHYGFCKNSQLIDVEVFGVRPNVAGVGDGLNAHSQSTSNFLETDIFVSNPYLHDNYDDGISWHVNCKTDVDGGLIEYNQNGVTPAAGGYGTLSNCLIRNNNIGVSVLGTNASIIVNNCVIQNNNINLYSDNMTSSMVFNNTTVTGNHTISGNMFFNNCIFN